MLLSLIILVKNNISEKINKNHTNYGIHDEIKYRKSNKTKYKKP